MTWLNGLHEYHYLLHCDCDLLWLVIDSEVGESKWRCPGCGDPVDTVVQDITVKEFRGRA